MIKKELTIIDEMGLHARPASQIVAYSNKFKCNIDIEHKDKKVNLKSVMLVMSLGVPHGSKINLYFDGEDEETACEELLKFIDSVNVAK